MKREKRRETKDKTQGTRDKEERRETRKREKKFMYAPMYIFPSHIYIHIYISYLISLISCEICMDEKNVRNLPWEKGGGGAYAKHIDYLQVFCQIYKLWQVQKLQSIENQLYDSAPPPLCLSVY